MDYEAEPGGESPNPFALPVERLLDESRVDPEDQVEGHPEPAAHGSEWAYDETRRQAYLAGGA